MSYMVSALAAEWIEIKYYDLPDINLLSPPSRRSGLKLFALRYLLSCDTVSALAAEWIEICLSFSPCPPASRLRPRGGVD